MRSSGALWVTGPIMSVLGATLLLNVGNVLLTAPMAVAESHAATPRPEEAPVPAGTEATQSPEGIWTKASRMNSGRMHHTATVLGDGRVLVAGGCVKAGALTYGSGAPVGCISPTNSAEIYDPWANKWSPAGKMKMARFHHAATLLSDGKVLVSGGCRDRGGNRPSARASTVGPNATPPPATVAMGSCQKPSSGAELYDPNSGRWSPTGHMTAPRNGHVATALPGGPKSVCGKNCGKVLVVGYDTSELYDPAQGTWRRVGRDRTKRVCQTAVRLKDGNVLVSGGMAGSGNEVEGSKLFVPSSGLWIATADPEPLPRNCHTANLLENGEVLILGGLGLGESPRNSFRSVVFYQPGEEAKGREAGGGTWREEADLETGRVMHTANSISGGAILVTRGISTSPVGQGSKDVDLYDPTGKTLKPAGEMRSGRSTFTWGGGQLPRSVHAPEFTAPTLQDGRVLMVGGVAMGQRTAAGLPGAQLTLDTAELYQPANFKPQPAKRPLTAPERDWAPSRTLVSWPLLAGSSIVALMLVLGGRLVFNSRRRT